MLLLAALILENSMRFFKTPIPWIIAALVLVGVLFNLDFQGEPTQDDAVGADIARDIESTLDTPECLSFTGHGTDENGNVYILGSDGFRYDLPVTETVRRVSKGQEATLEANIAQKIEAKFCLNPGAIQIDIENGKFKSLTRNNI